MQHHARQCPARALAPVGAAARRRAHPPVDLQGQPDPVVAALDAVLGDQLLVEVPGVEVPVAGVEQLQKTRHLVHPGAPRPGPGGGRTAPPHLPPRSGHASAGRCAPKRPRSPPPRPGSTHPGGCDRRPPRTSSVSAPVTAPSNASSTSLAWRRSKTGQIIWYIGRSYPLLSTNRGRHVYSPRPP